MSLDTTKDWFHADYKYDSLLRPIATQDPVGNRRYLGTSSFTTLRLGP